MSYFADWWAEPLTYCIGLANFADWWAEPVAHLSGLAHCGDWWTDSTFTTTQWAEAILL